MFLGEFGVTQEAPNTTRINWSKAVVDEALLNCFAYCYWEYNSGFGIYDSSTKNLNYDLVSALIDN